MEIDEVRYLCILRYTDLTHEGMHNVVRILDSIYHDGANGRHLCLLLELISTDGDEIGMRLTSLKADHVRIISKKILLGVDFSHRKKSLIHCGTASTLWVRTAIH
jgi:hypothetical protein